MSDAIHIEQGALPWKPSVTTELREVLHQYTIPLIGVVEQQGITYLFWCVTGHTGPENAWAYARVSEEDLVPLREADDTNFDDALRQAVGDRACTFAIASDEKGIIESVVLDPPATFDTAHERGMSELGQKFEEAWAEFQLLQDRFPQLRTAASFNIAPSPRASTG